MISIIILAVEASYINVSKSPANFYESFQFQGIKYSLAAPYIPHCDYLEEAWWNDAWPPGARIIKI